MHYTNIFDTKFPMTYSMQYYNTNTKFYYILKDFYNTLIPQSMSAGVLSDLLINNDVSRTRITLSRCNFKFQNIWGVITRHTFISTR